MYQCKEVAAAGNVKWDRAFRDIIDNIRVGLTLMVSNVAGMLILGIGRTLIDCHWGVEAFGKFSLALSLSDFFLQFISQVSLVLFPAFRKMDGRKIARTYKTLRTLLSLILSGMLLGYMPLYYLLTLWLPQYSDSLTYMALLLPICVFDGKMNLLCNTYLKVMRREKKLLQINIFALCFSILSCSFSAFVINNIYAVIISMVVSIALRSILGERYLSGCFKMQVGPSLAAEAILSFSFVITTWLLGPVEGFVFYAFVYLLYCITKYNDVKKMLSFLTRGGVKA